MFAGELYKASYVIKLLTVGVLVLLAISGLASPYEYNRLNVSTILELLLLLFFVLVFYRSNVIAAVFSGAAISYIVLSFLVSYYSGVHILDFLQAYKAFFYVVILSVFIDKEIFNVTLMKKFFWMILAFFLVKYVYSSILELTPRMGERPGLYVENNFELVFLILLLYVLKSSFSSRQYAIGFLVTFVVVYLSGSRSALVCLMLVFVFSYMLSISWLSIVYSLLGFLLVFSVFYIFIDRLDGGDIKSIDRVQFLLVFLNEVSDWSVLKFFFGNLALTPLSKAGCDTLSYYRLLFSYSGSGECYSVILHSYILRVIFDHGLVGLLFLTSFYAYGLKRNGHNTMQIICFISVIILTSLSVSAFNSVFVALIGIVSFSVYKEKQFQSDVSSAKVV